MTRVISPLAVDDVRIALKDWPGERQGAPFGLVVHTTGDDPWGVHRRLSLDPLTWVVSYYHRPEAYGPHYVGGHDGALFPISEETERALHCGISDVERELFLSGRWVTEVSPETLQRWRARWPGVKSPAHLYPGHGQNAAYIGLELLPKAPPPPWAPAALRFTPAQHELVATLWTDLAHRWDWPLDSWRTGRLVGHEDLNPLPTSKHKNGRSVLAGGWDPGALRARAEFSWELVYQHFADIDPAPPRAA